MKYIRMGHRGLMGLLSVWILSGCLKDKGYDSNQTQSTDDRSSSGMVEISLSAGNFKNFALLSFNNLTHDTTIKLVPVSYGGKGGAPSDLHINLQADNQLVTAYNSANGTNYATVDSSKITILNNGAVTIPLGAYTGYLEVKFTPSNFLDQTYAMGFSIKGVDKEGISISGPTGSGVVAFGVKNKYDGRYTITGTLVDMVSPSLSSVPGDPYPREVDLITSGPGSVAMFFPGVGYGHPIAGSSYGEFTPLLTFNGSDQVSSIVNYYGQPSPSRLRSGEMDPTGANRMNADHSIDLKYIMKQGGSLRTTFTEHLTYIGPRP